MKNNQWIWTLVQGIVAVVLGVWALIGRDSALTVLSYAAAIYMVIAGVIQTARALLNWGLKDSTTELVRGLIGLVGGAIVLILAYFTETSTPTILLILAVVVIAYGAVGLFSSLFARGGRSFEWQPVLVNVLLVILGVMILVDRSQPIDILLWTAIIFIICGAALIWYALAKQRNTNEVTPAI
ncbi:MAG: DUF308 domain-containing protein [Chloroflexota bacterium]